MAETEDEKREDPPPPGGKDNKDEGAEGDGNEGEVILLQWDGDELVNATFRRREKKA